MKIIILIFLSTLIVSCASKKVDKWTAMCAAPKVLTKSSPGAKKETKASFCHYTPRKDETKYGVNLKKGINYVGIKDYETQKWLVPLGVDTLWMATDEYSVIKRDEKFFKFIHSSKETEALYYDTKIDINLDTNNKIYSGYSLVGNKNEPNTLYFHHWTNYKLLKKIENVDNDIVLADKTVIKPYLSSFKGGYLIRHNVDGKKHYQYYTWNGDTSDKFKYAEKDIYFANTYIYIDKNKKDFVIMPYLKIAQGYYWPLLFNHSVMYNPFKNMVGIRANFKQNRLNIQRDHIVVWRDGNKKYMSLVYGPLKKIVSEASNQLFASKDIKKEKRYKDISIVKGTKVSYTGEMNKNADYYIYQEMNGKYFINDNGRKDFKSKSAVIKYLKSKDTNAYALSKGIKEERARKKQADRIAKQAKYDAAKRREKAFINMIHTYGLGSSGGTIGYDAEQYCAYRGPRCTYYRKQARSMQNARNAAAAAANRRRLNNLNSNGISEKAMIQNAKCRNAANRQNRHAGSIKYGCKNRYGK